MYICLYNISGALAAVATLCGKVGKRIKEFRFNLSAPLCDGSKVNSKAKGKIIKTL